MLQELFTLGQFHVRSYGAMIALGLVAGILLSIFEARRLRLDEEKILYLILLCVPAAIFGARVLNWIEHFEHDQVDWYSILDLSQGGLSLYGGVLGCMAMGKWGTQYFKLPCWTVADALTPALALGTVFIRVGCFLNGCCYGLPTDLPWGLAFPQGTSAFHEFGEVHLHPAQLYNAALGLCLFLFCWYFRPQFRTPGVLFWSLIGLYSLGRGIIDFIRAYDAELFVHTAGITLSISQWMSIGFCLISLLMIYLLKQPTHPATGTST